MADCNGALDKAKAPRWMAAAGRRVDWKNERPLGRQTGQGCRRPSEGGRLRHGKSCMPV